MRARESVVDGCRFLENVSFLNLLKIRAYVVFLVWAAEIFDVRKVYLFWGAWKNIIRVVLLFQTFDLNDRNT